jgi:predicted Rossmann fold nucleotide-binding protein DprA/Smf involved in DNA uptake
MRVIIAGGIDFDDYQSLCLICDYMLSNKSLEDIEIVSGNASGADKLGEKYAKDRGYTLKNFPADWSLGKKAGPIRNRQMANYADALICFWDGNSKGTNNMIQEAKKLGLKVKIKLYA